LPISELHWYIRGIYDYWNHTKEEVENSYIEDAKKYIIIDGVIYEETGEPRYVINTFGLGHNHGGTGLFVETYYNSNICKDAYFNALEREKAIKEADRIASRRGDTNDVGRFAESCNIEVLISGSVKCNPQIEAGEGDPFINAINGITESTSSINEAGLLSICMLANQMK
jgi:hypothetical protein